MPYLLGVLEASVVRP
jgi:DNA-binding response OmpR family regulator